MAMQHMIPTEWLSLAEIQASNETKLLNLPNLNGIGLGFKVTGGQETGEQALLALVTQKLPPEELPDEDKVPPFINGRPTDVLAIRDLFAGASYSSGGFDIASLGQSGAGLRIGSLGQSGAGLRIGSLGQSGAGLNIGTAPVTPSQALRRRRRPAMGGDSVGHPQVTAGTIATCCYDATAFPGIPSRTYILSNNHVLANSNSASINDPILQPAAFDGGTDPSDIIAQLSRFVPIRFKSDGQAPCNFVDAAIAEGEFSDLNREINWIGYVQGINASPNIGDLVVKTGRTTNFTTGKITAINATVDINYSYGRVARFCGQILTSNMSAGGDSGSLVLDLSKRAVGLLSANSPLITVVNPITPVLSLLSIQITE